MTFTYTSTYLSEIEASIPSRATSAGLANYQGLDIQKEADIRVDGEEVSIDGALKLAGLVGAPFLAVEGSVCSVEHMRAVYTHEYDGELPAAVEKLLRGAEKHDGSLMALTVTWVSQGLVYEWLAQSDWIDPLLARIRTALENAKAEADVEHEDSMDEYRVALQAAVSTLVESPKFRGEQVSKRSLVAPLILTEAGIEEPPPVLMRLRVMPEAAGAENLRRHPLSDEGRTVTGYTETAGVRESFEEPLTAADRAGIDDDIDAYLRDADLPPRPRGFSWLIRVPDNSSPEAFLAEVDAEILRAADGSVHPRQLRPVFAAVLSDFYARGR